MKIFSESVLEREFNGLDSRDCEFEPFISLSWTLFGKLVMYRNIFGVFVWIYVAF